MITLHSIDVNFEFPTLPANRLRLTWQTAFRAGALQTFLPFKATRGELYSNVTPLHSDKLFITAAILYDLLCVSPLDMDFTLRCNDLKCRAQLEDSAVVTTCSHVFCVSCSQSLGLATPAGSARICPACSTVLANPDDAVVTQLNPTEDYKTSVLSGLSPTIIMECAGRGLSFHSYQTNQEM